MSEITSWELRDTRRSPARLVVGSGDCVAMVYLTDANTKKRTADSIGAAVLIEAAPALRDALREMLRTEMFLPDHAQRQAAYKAGRTVLHALDQQAAALLLNGAQS